MQRAAAQVPRAMVDTYVNRYGLIVRGSLVHDRYGRRVTAGGLSMLAWLLAKWSIIRLGSDHEALVHGGLCAVRDRKACWGTVLPPQIAPVRDFDYKPRKGSLPVAPGYLAEVA